MYRLARARKDTWVGMCSMMRLPKLLLEQAVKRRDARLSARRIAGVGPATLSTGTLRLYVDHCKRREEHDDAGSCGGDVSPESSSPHGKKRARRGPSPTLSWELHLEGRLAPASDEYDCTESRFEVCECVS